VPNFVFGGLRYEEIFINRERATCVCGEGGGGNFEADVRSM